MPGGVWDVEEIVESFNSELLPDEPTRPLPRRNPVLSFLLETLQTILMALVLYFLIDWLERKLCPWKFAS